jgi:hypothetical protein
VRKLIKKILRESDDLDWIRDVDPIPEGIKKILTLPAGDYKIWLGDIPKEQQLNILDYIQNSISDSEEHTTNGNISSIRWKVDNNRLNINSLYFDVYEREHREEFIDGAKIKIILSIMAVYENEDEGPKEQQYEYCRNYFDESDDIEI